MNEIICRDYNPNLVSGVNRQRRRYAEREISKSKPEPGDVYLGFDTEYEENDRGGNDILSYQGFLIDPGTGRAHRYIYIVHPNFRGQYKRMPLVEFLVRVVRDAMKAGVLAVEPKRVTMVGHFTRADLSMFSDFHSGLKTRVSAIRKTYVTPGPLMAMDLPYADGVRRTTVAVIDTGLLAPEKTKLAELGALLGVSKLDIPAPYSIENMKLFLEEQPEPFKDYAIRDAEIAVRYALYVYDVFKSLGITSRVTTIASAGAAMFRKQIPDKLRRLEFLGQAYGPGSEKRKGWRPNDRIVAMTAIAADCFHGGLNTCYYVGYSPIGRPVLDIDLSGAYSTALAAIRWPDWDNARRTISLADLAVVDAAMTFAQVEFKFPPDTLKPCLPIRSEHQHGLEYPLEGISFCCGPELRVALDMGAEITVLDGHRVDWVPGSRAEFAIYGRAIAEGRKHAKAAGLKLVELIFKLLGNSLYGKIGQGVSAKRTVPDECDDHKIFNSETGEMIDLPPSLITSPIIVAWVTSFVRAMMSETVHRMPPSAIVLQVTTDGILFCGAESDIDVTGPVALAFRRARIAVTGEADPLVWEVKHRLLRVLTFRMRGMISVVAEDHEGKIHLAKAGARLPDHLKSDVEQSRYAEQLYRDREYDTQYERKDFPSLQTQYNTGCDYVGTLVKVRLSWCYDMKNRPVDPVDVEGVISFSTRPWRTLHEFEGFRKNFDDWRDDHHRVLKTVRDYSDFMEWVETRQARKMARTNARGRLPILAQAVLYEVLRRPLRERGYSYPELAQIFARATGKRVTAETVGNLRNKLADIPLQFVSRLTEADVEFAKRYNTHPFAFQQMLNSIVPGSPAAIQFSNIWEKRLPARVFMAVNDRCDDASEFVSDMPVALVAGVVGRGPAHQSVRPNPTIRSSNPVRASSLAERTAWVRIERVIEPAQPEQSNIVQDRPEPTKLEQLRIDTWVRRHLAAAWPGGCWHCRKPFFAGQKFVDVRGAEVVVRFHQQCESEWRVQQEALARKAMGLPVIERSSTKETTSA